jgi:cellulose synthase/poly-beta-1,6-N-acetylglucosamine synthase-like glycosyltransferase
MTPATAQVFLNLLLSSGSAILLMLTGLLLLESVVALTRRSRDRRLTYSSSAKAVVLMPAHNESLVIAETLQPLAGIDPLRIEIIVIADNCSDDTAQIARDMGATAIERFDNERRGKGFAMDHGLRYLEQRGQALPEVVVFLDADCLVTVEALMLLVDQAAQTQKPVQSTYLMNLPQGSGPNQQVSAFAFLVKNWVRLRGLSALGCPIVLTGSGMAFPWSVIAPMDLASGAIVEDMKLGIDLAIARHPVTLSPAQVTSTLAQKSKAAAAQRTRWEHGHMQSILTYAPQLLRAGLMQGRIDLLVFALDLCIPPLSLLVMMWVGMFSLSAALVAVGSLPLMLSAAAGVALLLAIVIAWAGYGRSLISLSQLVQIPFYILSKVPVYFKFMSDRQQAWNRTDRA